MSKEQSQEYHGNGNHTWERVTFDVDNELKRGTQTMRLRVPGGWLYREVFSMAISQAPGTIMAQNVVFVPMPEVVKHAI